MTELAPAGMTELARAVWRSFCAVWQNWSCAVWRSFLVRVMRRSRGGRGGVLVGWGAVGVGLEVGELALQRLYALVDAGWVQLGGDGG